MSSCGFYCWCSQGQFGGGETHSLLRVALALGVLQAKSCSDSISLAAPCACGLLNRSPPVQNSNQHLPPPVVHLVQEGDWMWSWQGQSRAGLVISSSGALRLCSTSGKPSRSILACAAGLLSVVHVGAATAPTPPWKPCWLDGLSQNTAVSSRVWISSDCNQEI